MTDKSMIIKPGLGQTKIVRSFCINTILSLEGEFLTYHLTFPVNEDFLEEYGIDNIKSKKMKSKKDNDYLIHYFHFYSKDFQTVKRKLLQLQIMVSTLKMEKERIHLNNLNTKLQLHANHD